MFFWPISEGEQPGDSHVFLHEVVFLISRRSSVARSTGTFLRRASEKKKIKRSRGNRRLLRGRKKTNTDRDFSRRTYRSYRKFLELVTSLFSSVTNYFSFFVDLSLKLSISDAQAMQLC